MTEAWGWALGKALGGVTGAVAWVRQARMFHPEGIVLKGAFTPLRSVPVPATTARLFHGPVLVRMSSAWWRGGKEWTDALGLAVRMEATPQGGEQDLLFATIRSPWTTLLAPLRTHVHDFLSNDYYAVSPFDIPGFGRARFRLVSESRGEPGPNRRERLVRAVNKGTVHFRLELQRKKLSEWIPVARLLLTEVVEVDQDALRFSPYRDGRGIVPRGFVHSLRIGTYRTSQRAGHPR
jgi:hypothetical protein